jgi:glycosyltransferase involved in cell wall biosynthesis
MSVEGKRTTTDPRVTVVIPTYQRRELAQRAVESVLSQSFQDFEVIVVDDGSTDGTEEGLSGLDDRIHYVRQENRGVERARNAALEQARGSIVAFLDDDDRWLADHLAAVVEVFERQPECVLVTTCPWYAITGRDRPEAARVVHPLPRLFVWGEVGWPSCVAARRDALLEIGGFDPEAGGETDLYLRLALKGPFAYLKRRTVVREELLTSLGAARRRQLFHLEGREVSARRILAELEEAPPPDPHLPKHARGNLEFVLALHALARDDVEAFRARVDAARRLLPPLSTEPELVIARLLQHLPGADERERALHVVSAAALAWPERDSPTAIGLRLHGARLAIRAGRIRLAGELLRGVSIGAGVRAVASATVRAR